MAPLSLALGSVTVAAGTVLAATTGTTGPDLAPWLQGGGSAAAVAGLVYVARLIVKGDLVPSAVAAREQETGAAIRASFEREAKMQELLEASQTREKEQDRIHELAIQALTRVESEQQRVAEELRWWRDRREQPQQPGRGQQR